MLEKLSDREKKILTAVIVVTAAVICYSFLIEPLFTRWKNTENRTKTLKVKLKKSLMLIKDKQKVDAEYAEYEKKLRSKGSDEQDMTVILDELEKIASRCGVKIASMRPKPAKRKDYYRKFTVEIETQSDMNSLMKFIYDIKHSKQMLKIERFNLNTKSSQQGVIIRASIIISKIVIK